MALCPGVLQSTCILMDCSLLVVILTLSIWQVIRRTFLLPWVRNPFTGELLDNGVSNRTYDLSLLMVTTVLWIFRLLPILLRISRTLKVLRQKVTVRLRLRIVSFMRLTVAIKFTVPLRYQVLIYGSRRLGTVGNATAVGVCILTGCSSGLSKGPLVVDSGGPVTKVVSE